ncbi:hypothetical protein D4R71_08570 [bacterium]|nr:MAG: hypothetical protein D4R71_08570 [bacterium]
MTAKTRSEEYVEYLCKTSFLTLFTHQNPIGKKGKELCDCLVVCGNNIIIISVKEIEYKDTGDTTGMERWRKSAIDKSVKQICGAERWIRDVEKIERSDGRVITLPEKENRNYHRISISLGASRKLPYSWEDCNTGYVHVFDEKSVSIIFSMFDTITDFVNFLQEIEDLQKKDIKLIIEGGVEDLVALYIVNGNSIEFVDENGKKADMVFLADDLWESFKKSEHYEDIISERKKSYLWDWLIEYYTKDLLGERMFDMYNKKITNNELAFIEMALQPRDFRIQLSEAYEDFLNIVNKKIRCRMVKAYNRTAFVFLAGATEDRKRRGEELMMRCHVVRGIVDNITTVVGIAADRPGTSDVGYSSDFVYMYKPVWTEKDEETKQMMQKELGYFKDAIIRK